ncbi:TauD/TfdA dioxygenase family protein [Achromobacter deleyi]|uniref:TauD/TfdA dioxygenase family protein n=1 Tax=Achromobacter deleyi TaxID=1353891 RepID=UPI001465583C|nr:TauD/TfdA family dioxygenase [Achromobacter deleyi]CAB3904402.1 Alpha-ketoglutarate-dependent taurine dioxygenase [Achromobacter deleyi]
MKIVAGAGSLGARILDIDLAQPLADADYRGIEAALGRHGVVSFPRQTLDAHHLKAFSERFGTLELNVANMYFEPGLPEVMILSNMVENGKPVGLSDAGQDWHTDMSYSRTIAFSNVLYGIRIPMRDGKSLGNTEFCNMHAAYDDLPEALKTELDGMTITHDFNKFWEMMRREKGSSRPPLTDEQKRRKPPVSHPVFLTHPITGRKVLYANPGYSVKINELPPARSDEVLDFLFKHQLQEKYRYRHQWQEGDVLMWDNMGTIHNAVADYRPDEPRLIKRCQVMADRYFPDLY